MPPQFRRAQNSQDPTAATLGSLTPQQEASVYLNPGSRACPTPSHQSAGIPLFGAFRHSRSIGGGRRRFRSKEWARQRRRVRAGGRRQGKRSQDNLAHAREHARRRQDARVTLAATREIEATGGAGGGGALPVFLRLLAVERLKRSRETCESEREREESWSAPCACAAPFSGSPSHGLPFPSSSSRRLGEPLPPPFGSRALTFPPSAPPRPRHVRAPGF